MAANSSLSLTSSALLESSLSVAPVEAVLPAIVTPPPVPEVDMSVDLKTTVSPVPETKEIKDAEEDKKETKEIMKDKNHDFQILQTWEHVKFQPQIIGYKVVSKSMKGWKDFEFKVGEIYHQSGIIQAGRNGHHYFLIP